MYIYIQTIKLVFIKLNHHIFLLTKVVLLSVLFVYLIDFILITSFCKYLFPSNVI